jgi:MoaA/NifB/PqqE/SkfB family radical SAM enzyme
MRFPLRLTADLGFGLALRSLGLQGKGSLIESVLPDGNLEPRSPIVWIGGTEPLEVRETPRVVNSLAAARRHVFLPTTGILLRRRIHEFQPLPRLHLTIRFDGAEVAHDGRAGRRGAFRDALESVRTAKLSGFLLCAQLILHAPSEWIEIERLHGELRELDFDGFLISAASPASEELRNSIGTLRRQLLGRRWALLSNVLDPVLTPAVGTATSPQSASRRSRETASQVPPRSCEESVQAP